MWLAGGELAAEARQAVLRSGAASAASAASAAGAASAASAAKVPACGPEASGEPAASLSPMGVVSFRQLDSRLTSYEFGSHPSFVGPAAGEGPVYRRMSRTMTLPDAAAPGLLPVYRRMASLPSMPEVSASPDSMLPKLAKQNAFCSSKHDDAAAAVPARGQASLLTKSLRGGVQQYR